MEASWGCLPLTGPDRTIERDWRFEALPELMGNDTVLAYGRGRSYGDSCINSHGTQLSTRRLNRFIRFDAEHGILNCEAGLTLDEILQVIVPRGWFLPVVPGTRFVTLGGAIANDVHGKNHHHAGSFGCHVLSLNLLRSDGTRQICTPSENGQRFAATIGGLGLTGLITSATVRLIPITCDELVVEDLPFNCIEEFTALSRQSIDWEYTVSWVDTFSRKGQVGRGIFSRARHAQDKRALAPGRSRPALGVPFAPPVSFVNRWTVNCFNQAYFWAGSKKQGMRHTHYQPFFFPLDTIANWNRVYGKNGFYQYQCVVPPSGSEQAIQTLMRDIHRSGEASFLAVLKEFGDRQSPGMLTFPRPGLTLALDFPNRGEKTKRLLASFDEIVMSVGGAIYPAKDARMSAAMFASGYSGMQEFLPEVDPKFSSAFWRRVQ